MKAIIAETLKIYSDGGMVDLLEPQFVTNLTLVFGLHLFSIIVKGRKTNP